MNTTNSVIKLCACQCITSIELCILEVVPLEYLYCALMWSERLLLRNASARRAWGLDWMIIAQHRIGYAGNRSRNHQRLGSVI